MPTVYETLSPVPFFADAKGTPLSQGYIYYGVVNTNPETNPIVVYWDSAGTIPAAQPIRTLNGCPVRDGASARVFAASAYSITVRDVSGTLVLSQPNITIIAALAGVLSYPVRNAVNAAALAAALTDGSSGMLGGSAYTKSNAATGVLSCTNDLAVNGLIPSNGSATPNHFGGLANNTDETVIVQACIDFVKNSFINGAWPYTIHLNNQSWKTKSLNFTNIRTPGFTVTNGTILGYGALAIILDLTGSNNVKLFNITVVGDATAPPASGIHIGRDSTAAIAPNMKGVMVKVIGSYTVAALVNMSSEDSLWYSSEFENNGIINGTATGFGVGPYAVIHDGNATDMLAKFPTYVSPFRAWFTGAASNINHDYFGCIFRQKSSDNFAITSITKAASAVISALTSDVAGMRMVVGSWVYFDGIVGMTELNGTPAKITAINSGAGTVTVALDTTTFSTFTSGNIRTRTGPALLLAGVRNFNLAGAYVLAYDVRKVEVDLTISMVTSNIKICAQFEPDFNTLFWLTTDAASTPIRHFDLLNYSSNQNYGSIFQSVGSSGIPITFADFKYSQGAISAAMTTGLFFNPSLFKVFAGDVTISRTADLTVAKLPPVFWGSIVSSEDGSQAIYGSTWSSVATVGQLLSVSDTILTQQTALAILTYNGTSYISKTVQFGAVDSGGTGFRTLRVVN